MTSLNGEFRQALDILAGLIVSSIVAAAVVSLCSWDGRLFSIMIFGTAIFGTIFGLPTYGIAYACNRASSWTAAAAGLVIGGIPIFFGWMIDSSGAHGAAELLKEFAPVAVGGICGGLIFWFVVRPIDVPRWRWTFLKLALAAATIGAIFLLPQSQGDRSCHNPLRDGRKSIGANASFDLHIGVDQWPALAAEMDAFARSGR